MSYRPIMISVNSRASLSLWMGFWVVAAAALSCAQPAAAPRTAAVVAAKTSAPPAPPPLALVPADVARAGLVATFVVPSLDRSLASGVALVKQAAPLPLDVPGVRDMLLAQAGLPPEVARHLDIGAPIAGAVVVNDRGSSPLAAFSFAARSPGDAIALFGALGKTISRRGNAVQIENAAGDRGWFLPLGTLVVFADTDDALVRAGSLAVEARRETKDDISVILYPEMMARAAGTPLETALNVLRQSLEERAAAGGNKLGPEGARQVRLLVDYLGDIATAELALDLDAERGAAVLARVHPKADSKLAALARENGTTSVDPALRHLAQGSDEAGVVLASTYAASTLEQLARVRSRLGNDSGKIGAAALAAAGGLLDALAAGLNGHFSMTGRVQPALSWEIIWPARDAAGASRIQAALLANDKQALAAVLRAATQDDGLDHKDANAKVLKVKRETVGKTRVIHATVGVTLPAHADPAIRKLLGPSAMDVFLAVVGGDRVAMTAGAGAKARMAAIAAAGGAPRMAESGGPEKAAGVAMASDAAAAVGVRSLFFMFDLRQALGLVAAVGGDPRMRMLSGSMRKVMPLLGGAAGDAQGRTLTLDLTIPPACFSGIGAVVQAAMLMPR